MTIRDIVELFHLQFLRVLCASTDRDLFTLKGGVNLRFFFGSVRYSEDIDLDVSVTPRTTLKNRIDRLLEATTLLAPLWSQGVSVVDVSAPK